MFGACSQIACSSAPIAMVRRLQQAAAKAKQNMYLEQRD
jgi:hypothetical protein